MFRQLSRLSEGDRASFNVALRYVAGVAGVLGAFMLFGGIFPDESTENNRLTWIAAGAGLWIIALLCVALMIKIASSGGRGHLQKYEAILTGVESRQIQDIAEIANLKPKRVRSEIHELIELGVIDDFYLDHKHDRVVSTRYLPKSSYKTVVTCSRCGHNNVLIVGITKHCTACGQALALSQ